MILPDAMVEKMQWGAGEAIDPDRFDPIFSFTMVYNDDDLFRIVCFDRQEDQVVVVQPLVKHQQFIPLASAMTITADPGNLEVLITALGDKKVIQTQSGDYIIMSKGSPQKNKFISIVRDFLVGLAIEPS